MDPDRAFLALFQPAPDDLKPEEIRSLLEKELASQDPDAELIGFCLDALSEPRPGAVSRNPRHPRLKAAALAAAVLALLLFGLTAAAAVLRPDFADPLVRLFEDRLRVGHAEEPVSGGFALLDTALAKALAENGFPEVLLPRALTDGTFRVKKVTCETTALVKSANIRFSSGKTKGTLVISVYAPDAPLPVTDYANAENVAAFGTARIEGCVFTQAGEEVLDFSDGRTVYTVILNGTREEALAFAETIQ